MLNPHPGPATGKTTFGGPTGPDWTLTPLPALRSGSIAAGDAERPVAALPQIHLLIVDDEAPLRSACREIAASMGFITQVAESVAAARSLLAQSPFDLVLLDMKMPGEGGLVLLEEIRRAQPTTVVVVMTAFATVSSAVEAMRIGASDYLTKPFTLEVLSTVLERAARRRSFDLESRSLRERLRGGKGMSTLIGASPAMEKLYRILSKVAATAHPVLIAGEPGTGKELVARSIHAHGPGASRPFVPVDCVSLVPALIEQELFGVAKATGNGRPRAGLLAAAQGGTVYLDEIGELSLEMQARLLRALQDRQVRPVGGSQPVALTVRLLAATSRDLEAMVRSGRFRKDLYFRLNVVSLRIPPLRERRDDITLLAAHILARVHTADRPIPTFTDDAIRLLIHYDWPGNVRELEQAVERACSLSSGPQLHMGDFPVQLQSQQQAEIQRRNEARQNQASRAAAASHVAAHPGVLSIAQLEKQAILTTIRDLDGDKLTAARLLGIGKTTLYRKLKEYDLTDDQLRA